MSTDDPWEARPAGAPLAIQQGLCEPVLPSLDALAAVPGCDDLWTADESPTDDTTEEA